MEPVEVTARFSGRGELIPINFTWQGVTYPVDSTGRRWQDDKGQHILVMVPGERVFELLFVTGEMRWYLDRIRPGQTFA